MKPVLLALIFLCIYNFGFCQWNTDTLVRNPVCTAPNLQYEPQMCSDGLKGVIITWADLRSNQNISQQIYAQRLDGNGITKWINNGVPISIEPGGLGADEPAIVSDLNGGAIIFSDVTIGGGSEQIFAQHLDANGDPLWNNYGARIDTVYDSRIGNIDATVNQTAVTDDNGGAFITWYSYTVNGLQIYAQHIDKNGNTIWQNQGLKISNNNDTLPYYLSSIISTGKGTAVVAYSYNNHLRLQRIDSSGVLLWGTDGINIADSLYFGDYNNFFLGFDSNSSVKNVKIIWIDERNSTLANFDLYAQKVDLNGNLLWQAGGIPVDTTATTVSRPILLTDNSGGFYTTYSTPFVMKVQHVNSSGSVQWGNGGIQTVNFNPFQTLANICSDGSNGIIATWHDQRNGQQSIYSQRYNPSGFALWRADGVPVIVGNVDVNHSVHPLVSLNNGTAITCWSDTRNIANGNDIYAAKFGGSTGILPLELISFTGTIFKGTTQLNWQTTNEINSSYFEVQRSVDGINYSMLCIVKNKGNYQNINSYKAIDAVPFNGSNYYRLKEIDIDGRFSYSPVIRLDFKKFDWNILGNPVSNNSWIQLQLDRRANVSVQIVSLNGNIIQTISKGIIQTGTYSIPLDLIKAPSGIYIVRLIIDDQNYSKKIIK